VSTDTFARYTPDTGWVPSPPPLPPGATRQDAPAPPRIAQAAPRAPQRGIGARGYFKALSAALRARDAEKAARLAKEAEEAEKAAQPKTAPKRRQGIVAAERARKPDLTRKYHARHNLGGRR
jgi:hypothetical protein